MKVYIVTQTKFPHGMAACRRIKCYSAGLTAAGIPCEVIVAKRTERFNENSLNQKSQGMDNGIPFRYMGDSPIRSRHFLRRRWDDFRDQFRTLRFLKQNCTSSDIILCYFYSLPLSLMVLIAGFLTGAKTVLEVCELPFEYQPLQRWLALHCFFPYWNGFLAISEALEQVVLKYKSSSASVILIPILVNPEEYHATSSIPETIRACKPFLLHTGSLWEIKDGILGILNAFALADRQLGGRLHYFFTGKAEDSPQSEMIQNLITENNLEGKVIFTGYLADEEIKSYQQNCFLTIINKYPNWKNTYCFSSKLAEYLVLGKPVIITRVGEAMHYLNDENAYIVEPNRPDVIAQAIVNAYRNPAECERIGNAGRNVALTEFNCIRQAERLRDFFQSLCLQ